MRIMLANNDKPHRCPAWSVKDLGCVSGSFAQAGYLWEMGRNPNHMLLKCSTCGTWRLPTFGFRLPVERIIFKTRLWWKYR